jgi:hypothetical protein
MSDMNTARARAALQEAFALSRAESHQLLDQVGQCFADEVRVGRLLLGVDRGFARKFLTDPRSEAISRRFGASLCPPRTIMNAVMILEPLCGLGLMVLAFSLLGWWGLAVLVLLPFVIWRSWQNSLIVRHRARLPKVLTIAFLSYGMYALWEQLPAQHLAAALLGCILFGAAVAKYAYPTWRIRRLVNEHPELCSTLIDADVVVLRRPAI